MPLHSINSKSGSQSQAAAEFFHLGLQRIYFLAPNQPGFRNLLAEMLGHQPGGGLSLVIPRQSGEMINKSLLCDINKL